MPVLRFLSQLLGLLFIQSEKLEAPIIRHIKEVLSHELNPTLYSCLFEQIRINTDKFFDANGHVSRNKFIFSKGNFLNRDFRLGFA